MPSPGKWYFKSLEDCINSFGSAAFPTDGLYCNATWDKVLCWPATPAGEMAHLPCPPLRGLDTSQFGYKKCGSNGRWEGKTPGDYSTPQGWTNYSACYTMEARKLYEKIFGSGDAKRMKEIARAVQMLEMVGLNLSLLSLLISLFIFFYFRSLKCSRTRIHRNLFVAILIHVIIRLTKLIDELLARNAGDVAGSTVSGSGTIYSTAVLCEILQTLVEYTKTVMFMWMFLEGIFLHDVLAWSVFSGKPNYLVYYIVGWGCPVLMTLVWAVTNGLTQKERCWFGYTFRPHYWIIEGPRAAIIGVNLLFLLNIIRVLVTKLRESHSTEAQQVRKAVKAAIVLLPLLGITNCIEMVEAPTNNPASFGVVTVLSGFLRSFQGFFIALIYCFLNGEVQATLRVHWERYWQSRGHYGSARRRLSRTMSIFTSVSEVPNQVNKEQRKPSVHKPLMAKRREQ